jgi:hypothetical protein
VVQTLEEDDVTVQELGGYKVMLNLPIAVLNYASSDSIETMRPFSRGRLGQIPVGVPERKTSADPLLSHVIGWIKRSGVSHRMGKKVKAESFCDSPLVLALIFGLPFSCHIATPDSGPQHWEVDFKGICRRYGGRPIPPEMVATAEKREELLLECGGDLRAHPLCLGRVEPQYRAGEDFANRCVQCDLGNPCEDHPGACLCAHAKHGKKGCQGQVSSRNGGWKCEECAKCETNDRFANGRKRKKAVLGDN